MYVISTQTLENYGAHSEDGKHSSGNAYWKFKGGNDYIVSTLDRIQDAAAFVAALCMENDISYKEFPVTFRSYDEWKEELGKLSPEYAEFLESNAISVSPGKEAA